MVDELSRDTAVVTAEQFGEAVTTVAAVRWEAKGLGGEWRALRAEIRVATAGPVGVELWGEWFRARAEQPDATQGYTLLQAVGRLCGGAASYRQGVRGDGKDAIECPNCARHRVLGLGAGPDLDGVCEKCGWDVDGGDYAVVTRPGFRGV